VPALIDVSVAVFAALPLRNPDKLEPETTPFPVSPSVFGKPPSFPFAKIVLVPVTCFTQYE
jgi:hypothetical protein